jgi:membrane protein
VVADSPASAGEAARPASPASPTVALWRLTLGTVSICMRYRVTGLAAEAAFFALLSLPPLVLGVVASIGYFANLLDQETVASVTRAIINLSSRALTEESIEDVVVPTLNEVQKARSDIVSIGFLIALWSGSRALNVYVDTITIMYGLGGRRGIVRTRVLSFTLYVVGQ